MAVFYYSVCLLFSEFPTELFYLYHSVGFDCNHHTVLYVIKKLISERVDNGHCNSVNPNVRENGTNNVIFALYLSVLIGFAHVNSPEFMSFWSINRIKL